MGYFSTRPPTRGLTCGNTRKGRRVGRVRDPPWTLPGARSRWTRRLPYPPITEGKTIMAKGKKSDWLGVARSKDTSVKECKACKGTGDSGQRDDKGRTIVCPSCRGFGY